MGSSRSKPRKGHEHPDHLPKVGSPAQEARSYDARMQEVFGSTWVRVILLIVAALIVVGLVFLFI